MDRRALLGLAAVAVSAAAARPVQAAGSSETGAPAPAFRRLPTLSVNVRRHDGRNGIMTVETGVEALSPGYAEKIVEQTPRLRAAYGGAVRQVAAETLPGAPPNLERLVRLLQAETVRVLEGPGARVLLGTVMVV